MLMGQVLVFIGLLYLYGSFYTEHDWKQVIVFIGLMHSISRYAPELIVCTHVILFTMNYFLQNFTM